MARPRKVVDVEMVENLAAIGCSTREIASIVDASERVLQRRFAAPLEKGRSRLFKALRRKQVELALAGNVTMLIWLGKQMLGQKDKHESTVREEIVTIEEIAAKVVDRA